MKFPAFEPINLANHQTEHEVLNIPLNTIIPDEKQPRKIFSDQSLHELADSIRQHGIIQPIIVREENTKYILIAGERRWRAAKLAQLKTIPAIVREYTKANRMAITLIENIQRENLNPLEEARAINDLLTECNMTHNEIAESIGRSRSTVTNLLRLLNLASQVQNMVMNGHLEMGHARALLCLPSDKQIEIANNVMSKQLSVRETEKLVNKCHELSGVEKKIVFDKNFENKMITWKNLLSNKLSTKIYFDVYPGGKGKIVIKFDSIDEANWIMDHVIFTDT